MQVLGPGKMFERYLLIWQSVSDNIICKIDATWLWVYLNWIRAQRDQERPKKIEIAQIAAYKHKSEFLFMYYDFRNRTDQSIEKDGIKW